MQSQTQGVVGMPTTRSAPQKLLTAEEVYTPNDIMMQIVFVYFIVHGLETSWLAK